MNTRKLAHQIEPSSPVPIPRSATPPAVATSYIQSLAPEMCRPSFESVHFLAPLLEEMTQKMGGSIVITSEGADIFHTANFNPQMMTAEDGIMELEVGGRTAQIRFLRQSAAASPALMRFALLGQIVPGIMHDINNLLVSINGNAGFMRYEKFPFGDGMDEARDEQLREIMKAADAIASICRRVQSFSSRKHELSIIRVSDAVQDSLMLGRPFINEALHAGKTITVESSIDSDLWCMADLAELQSCMVNVIKNAMEHGFDGLNEGRLVINAEKGEGLVSLNISNNGNMIPETVAANLLRRPVSDDCNSGIGLYTAAERLRSFGAWMTFTSGEEWTTFSITMLEARAGR